jgi:hypothetical protein
MFMRFSWFLKNWEGDSKSSELLLCAQVFQKGALSSLAKSLIRHDS